MTGLHRLLYNPRASRLRMWIFNIHLYAGLALGLAITLVGLTGSLIVYKPETERLLSSGISVVRPLNSTVYVERLFAQAHAFRPADRIDRLYTWGGPTAAWMFRTIRPDGRRQYIYVDQYRGTVLGEYVLDGSALQWAYELHDNLLLGKSGLIANGFGALLLTVLCLSGLVIWWPGVKRIVTGFHFHPRAGWKTQAYDIHKILGFVSVVSLAVIAISGASYAFPETYRRVAAGVTATAAYFAPPESRPAAGSVTAQEAPLEQVFATASQTLPGAELTILTFPASRNAAFTVRKRLPQDWSRLGNQYVYIDRFSGQVLRVDRFDQLPAGARLVQSMAPLHYGSFGGHFTRILWIFMGLVPGVLSISGFLMWWNRVIVKRLRRFQVESWSTPESQTEISFPG